MLSGLSYGAYAPSLEMQRLQNTGAARANRRARAVARRNAWCALVMDLIHPGNYGTLPPSPEHLLWRGVQTGLLNKSEVWKLHDDLR